MGGAADVIVERCEGQALAAALPDLAALQIEVFRAWPYLYEGRQSHEQDYLRTYLDSPGAAVFITRKGSRVVGASTCLPLSHETENVQAPFRARAWDPEDFFYFGESVLLPELRGQGIGVAFFAAREAHARAVSACRFACFCVVVRPDSHPARPPDYVPLDRFWTKRGFVRRPDLVCEMSWTDVGAADESAKKLVFWVKSLDGSPIP